jgi:Ca2+-binding RTX toxin-like protein
MKDNISRRSHMYAVLCVGFFAMSFWAYQSAADCSSDYPHTSKTIYSGTSGRDYIIWGNLQINWGGTWIDAGIGICRFDMDTNYNKVNSNLYVAYASAASEHDHDTYNIYSGADKDLIRFASSGSSGDYCGYFAVGGGTQFEYRITSNINWAFEEEHKYMHFYGEAGDDKIYTCRTYDSGTCWINDTNSDCDVLLKAHGGDNADFLYGGTVTDGVRTYDYLYGDGGSDTLRGYGNADYMEGGSGNDYLYGGEGDDCLYGLDGDDYLQGDNGEDWLNGGNHVNGDECWCTDGYGKDVNCENISDCWDTIAGCYFW